VTMRIKKAVLPVRALLVDGRSTTLAAVLFAVALLVVRFIVTQLVVSLAVPITQLACHHQCLIIINAWRKILSMAVGWSASLMEVFV